MAKLTSELELTCPCCGAIMVVDAHLGRIVSHHLPERGDKPELNQAQRILADAEARREALFLGAGVPGKVNPALGLVVELLQRLRVRLELFGRVRRLYRDHDLAGGRNGGGLLLRRGVARRPPV